MYPENNQELSNTITVNGITFKTGGNIVFSDAEESKYYLAQNKHLAEMEGFLENGMQLLLKKMTP